MDSRTMPSPEELEKMLEKAKKEAEAALAKLTPEQRAEAEMRAKKLMEEDAAAMRELVESASKLSAGAAPKAARECPHCLAPVGSGRVCEYCGSPLED
jgi:phage I-like protein